MIYLLGKRITTKSFYQEIIFVLHGGSWGLTFCGMLIIMHSFNNYFVNAVTNIVTRGRIPTLRQRPPFDLNCIFAENYEIKAFPDICKPALIYLRYIHTCVSRGYAPAYSEH